MKKIIILIASLSIVNNVYAKDALKVISSDIKDVNIKNALVQYYGSFEKYLKNKVPANDEKLSKIIINDINCIEALSAGVNKKHVHEWLAVISTEMNSLPNYQEKMQKLEGFHKKDINSTLNKGDIKQCSFKINEEQLIKKQNEAKAINAIVEEDYAALVKYKEVAHPAMKSLIINLERLLDQRGQLNDEIKKTPEYKEQFFKLFTLFFTTIEMELISREIEISKGKCKEMAADIYKKNCAGKAVYDQIPGNSFRTIACYDDFAKLFKPECNYKPLIPNKII